MGGDAADDAGRAALHPLLARRPEKKVALRRAHGATAGSAARSTRTSTRPPSARGARRRRAGATVAFVTLGRKGREYLDAPRRARSSHDFPRIYDGLDLDEGASSSRAWLVPRFKRGEFDAVYLVYNEFKSAITQKVDVERAPPARRRRRRRRGARATAASAPTEFLFEPDQQRAARAARADVRRDHASIARSSRARRASSARR